MKRDLSTIKCKRSWKKCALLLILLTHAVFGSPIVSSSASFASVEPVSQTYTSNENNIHSSLEEDIFGPTLDERGSREKRLLFETLKKAKQAKLLALGTASAGAAKSIGKSILKTVATLGIKAIIFNFLYTKINQVLDFKTRLLNNLDHKNREQNSQVLGHGDSNTAGSGISSTESPGEQLPEFNPDKVSLQVPDAVFGPSFNIANGASQVLGTLIQNTALRIAKLFDALKPLLRSSITYKSKKREADDLGEFEDDTKTSTEGKAPIKASYAALVKQN